MYVKLFSSLYQGTLRGRSDEILVFTNLLAHADQYGIVDKHWRAISEETGLSRERVDVAILNLEAPDPESRSPEMDGCRIVRLDDHRAWGWKVVNYGKYRSIRNEDDRKEQNRQAQERWRNKSKITVSEVSHGNPPSSQAEAKEEELKSTTLSSKLDGVSSSKLKLNGFKTDAAEILTFLNTKTGRNYRQVAANIDMIAARLKDGSTVAECRQVIAKKYRDWHADEKMAEFLRPATLFNKLRFAQYQGEIGTSNDPSDGMP